MAEIPTCEWPPARRSWNSFDAQQYDFELSHAAKFLAREALAFYHGAVPAVWKCSRYISRCRCSWVPTADSLSARTWFVHSPRTTATYHTRLHLVFLQVKMAPSTIGSSASHNSRDTGTQIAFNNRRSRGSNFKSSIINAQPSIVTEATEENTQSNDQSPTKDDNPRDGIEALARDTNKPPMPRGRRLSESISAGIFPENPEKDHLSTQQAYNNIKVQDGARAHLGNVYNYFGGHAEGSWSDSSQGQGFTFSMDTYAGNVEGKSLFASTSKLRLQHVSTKQLSVSTQILITERAFD